MVNQLKHLAKKTILDSQQYEHEYLDGNTAVLTEKILAENLMAKVDDHGNRHLLTDKIEDHRISK